MERSVSNERAVWCEGGDFVVRRTQKTMRGETDDIENDRGLELGGAARGS